MGKNSLSEICSLVRSLNGPTATEDYQFSWNLMNLFSCRLLFLFPTYDLQMPLLLEPFYSDQFSGLLGPRII